MTSLTGPALSLLTIIGGLLHPTPIGHDIDPTLITTAYGKVQGQQVYSDKFIPFYRFLAIPFAKPPVGNLRFKDPQLPDKWTGTLDARFESPPPFGLDQFGANTIDFTSSEDCLKLNVFSRQTNTNHRAPVMVFIYGGGFIQGSSQEMFYGPDFFMQKDVVLVTFNYRIGALGFLSIDEEGYQIPGNAGLKDQAFALLWVRQNIARFGGDPDNITVFGNSAGGASIHYHMISPYSEGLFHKAIIESGSAFNPWASNSDPTLNARLAEKLGWNGLGGTAGIYNTLMSASPYDIVYAQDQMTVAELQRGDLFLFVPRLEPYNNNGSCIVSDSIQTMSETAWGIDIPLLIGGNKDEGYLHFFNFINQADVIEDPVTYFQNALPKELNLTRIQRQKLGNELRQFYFGENMPDYLNIQELLVPLLTDKLFWQGVESVVRSRLNRPNSQPTYLYHLSFISNAYVLLELFLVGGFVNAAFHAAELLYLFDMMGTNDFMPDNSGEGQAKITFINAWTQFAATGNPNGGNVQNWEPVQNNNLPLKCYNIDETNTFIDLPETKRLAFWNSLHSFV